MDERIKGISSIGETEGDDELQEDIDYEKRGAEIAKRENYIRNQSDATQSPKRSTSSSINLQIGSHIRSILDKHKNAVTKKVKMMEFVGEYDDPEKFDSVKLFFDTSDDGVSTVSVSAPRMDTDRSNTLFRLAEWNDLPPSRFGDITELPLTKKDGEYSLDLPRTKKETTYEFNLPLQNSIKYTRTPLSSHFRSQKHWVKRRIFNLPYIHPDKNGTVKNYSHISPFSKLALIMGCMSGILSLLDGASLTLIISTFTFTYLTVLINAYVCYKIVMIPRESSTLN